MDIQTIMFALLKAVPWTIGLTLISFVLGSLLGILICALTKSKFAIPRYLGFIYILILRSIPPITFLFLIFFGLGTRVIHMSPFVASVVGLLLITSANMAEVYRGVLAAIPKGQYEAAFTTGLSKSRTFLDVIAPQVFRFAIPSAATFCVGLLKDSALASTIGVPEITHAAYQITQLTFAGIKTFALAALYYFILSLIMAWFSRSLYAYLRQQVA